MYNRIVILTGDIHGQAAEFLTQYESNNHLFTLITYRKPRVIRKWRKKKLLKIIKVGILGLIINRYLLPKRVKVPLLDNIEVKIFDSLNSAQMIKYIKDNNFDLGLSLGNSYISSKVFTSFRYGMWNIHHERLPNYPNCQPVFWSIFHREKVTGWTIHEVDKGIDTGKCLLRGENEILWRKNLISTINDTFEEVRRDSTLGLIKLLEIDRLHSSCEGGNESVDTVIRWHTTPSLLHIISAFFYNRYAWYRHNK